MIIAQCDTLNKRFIDICKLTDPKKQQQLLDNLCGDLTIAFTKFLDKAGKKLYLGSKYGEGSIGFNGIRFKKILAGGHLLVMRLPRIRSRECHFCQLLIPSFAVPYLSTPVTDIVSICVDAKLSYELFFDPLKNTNLYSILQRFSRIQNVLLDNGIFLGKEMNLSTLSEKFIQITHYQFFSPYFNPGSSFDKRKRAFTDISVTLHDYVHGQKNLHTPLSDR